MHLTPTISASATPEPVFLTIAPPGALTTAVADINDEGAVVGYYYDPTKGPERGFLWLHGTFTSINPPGSTYTTPSSINNGGTVAGTYEDRSGTHGFVWRNGAFTIIDLPGSAYTQVTSINDDGTVAGRSFDTAGWKGFVWTRGAFTTFRPPSGSGEYLQVNGINDVGMIVGQFGLGRTRGAFMWQRGTVTALTPPDSLTAAANAVNNDGTVVGSFVDSLGLQHGFAWRRGFFSRIDLPGASSTQSATINNAGTVAGWSHEGEEESPSGSVEQSDSSWHGFLWQRGTFASFETPAGSGLQLSAINDRGTIIGTYASDDASGVPVIYGFVYALGKPSNA